VPSKPPDDLGPQRLKGFAEPLAAWRVVAESRAEGRFEAHTRLSPLVGRDEELSLTSAPLAAGGRRRWPGGSAVRRAGHAQDLLAALGPAELPAVIAQAP
jgi:hypothetical protein